VRKRGTIDDACVNGRICSSGHSDGSMEAARVKVDAVGEKWDAEGLRIDLSGPLPDEASAAVATF